VAADADLPLLLAAVHSKGSDTATQVKVLLALDQNPRISTDQIMTIFAGLSGPNSGEGIHELTRLKADVLLALLEARSDDARTQNAVARGIFSLADHDEELAGQAAAAYASGATPLAEALRAISSHAQAPTAA
jgi:hypothetical protein